MLTIVLVTKIDAKIPLHQQQQDISYQFQCLFYRILWSVLCEIV